MKKNDFLKLNKEDLKGKIVCFSTDTVFGVGALMNDVVAVKKIYALKHRDFNKPLAILASKVDDILPYIDSFPKEVRELMDKYWPGALTIIFNKNKNTENKVNEEFKTVGFRIPASNIALDILEKFGPMATTSINLSGEAPLNDYKSIVDAFGDKIDYIIEDTAPSINVSSTVVDASTDNWKILREGSVKIK